MIEFIKEVLRFIGYVLLVFIQLLMIIIQKVGVKYERKNL